MKYNIPKSFLSQEPALHFREIDKEFAPSLKAYIDSIRNLNKVTIKSQSNDSSSPNSNKFNFYDKYGKCILKCNSDKNTVFIHSTEHEVNISFISRKPDFRLIEPEHINETVRYIADQMSRDYSLNMMEYPSEGELKSISVDQIIALAYANFKNIEDFSINAPNSSDDAFSIKVESKIYVPNKDFSDLLYEGMTRKMDLIISELKSTLSVMIQTPILSKNPAPMSPVDIMKHLSTCMITPGQFISMLEEKNA